jgi:hypothetical protein
VSSDENGKIKVDPANCVIILGNAAAEPEKNAAAELEKHLKLITGKDIPRQNTGVPAEGKYSFLVGIPAPGDTKKFEAEEARRAVTPAAAYFYGDSSNGRKGCAFAVYSFLEDEFGARWIEPGDNGIVYSENPVLAFKTGTFSWTPKLAMRSLRAGIVPGSPEKAGNSEFKVFEKSLEAHNRDVGETNLWRDRMRMGNSSGISYGHAFTHWWEKYGASHPEYFALNKYGKREPEIEKSKESTADNPLFANLKAFKTIKICPGNPDVAKQIIKNWLETSPRPSCVNVCENDSPPMGFCRCEACRKLDGHNDDLDVYQVHLTDRYIHLVNEVAKEAVKYDPAARVSTYVYNETEAPPRRERLAPNIVLGMVPTTVDLERLDKWYKDWRKMGAQEMFLRPNYHHYYYNIGVPTGFERRMFDAFQAAVKNGCLGADYDSMMRQWTLSGISDYILARAMGDPSKPFEVWEDEYCSAFGPAAGDAKEYFRYWRDNVWEKRLAPNLNDIVAKGKYHNFARGLMWSLSKYYTEEDFDKTDAILKKAAEKSLSAAEKKRLDKLTLSNQHSRLVFNAITTKEPEKFKYSKELFDFRIRHKDDLNLSWLNLIDLEDRAGDIAGVQTAALLGRFSQPWLQTPLFWSFKIDPEDKGLAGGWQKTDAESMKKSWDVLPTNSPWETPGEQYKNVSAELREKLKNYDGIGWYGQEIKVPAEWKNRQVYLFFGAVDESCWIYVNGVPVGAHPFVKPDDWCTPFPIRIDQQINWSLPSQTVIVRVEDKAGSGGIWKRVWLVSKENKN